MRSYHDIQGDGGSGIAEQVAAQRARALAALRAVRRVVAVGSGKGGVGKSTLTHGLAAALARRGQRVAILDADLNGPSQAHLAGLGTAPLVPAVDGTLSLPRNREGIGVVSLGTLLPEDEALAFPSVAAGESHVWRATREFAFLGQLLGSVAWGELDLLLVDLPPGAERTVQYAEFFGREAEFVLVTIPQALALGVVARSLAALAETPNRVLGYVENMSGYACSGCGTVRPLFPPEAGISLDLACLGRVPFDPALAAGGPTAGSAAGRALDEIAAVLEARSFGATGEVLR